MKQILITEQENELFHFVKEALQGKYNIISLPKDTELIAYLKRHQADFFLLTISDYCLEAFRTLDIIKRIPEMSRKPIVFLTEENDPKLEKKALAAGADDYLKLPVTPELLLHRVNTYMELYQLRTERPYVEKYQDAISISFAELVECRDVTTGGHLKNTTTYFSILLKEAMVSDKYKDIIPAEDVRDLLRSATLHDIGKIGITDEILHKASSLDYNEFEYMKTHTTLGKQAFEKIIKETGGTRWLYFAKDIAYCHHERWDGTGYPKGLRGEEIPLYARMLTIADVYDALTSNRTYKKAFSHEEATEIIVEGKGSYFDPYLVELFVKANGCFEEMLKKNNEALKQ